MSNSEFILFGTPPIARTDTTANANITAGNPKMGVWLYADNPATGSRSGIWECTAGDHRALMDGYMEFCHIIEGEADITLVRDGSTRRVKAGDSFVMEPGLEMDWHVPNYVRKSFVISQVVSAEA